VKIAGFSGSTIREYEGVSAPKKSKATGTNQ